MSQDLFAAFGVPDQGNKSQETAPSHSSDAFASFKQTQSSNGADVPEDDDWGEFEGTSSNTVPSNPPMIEQTARYQYNLDDLSIQKPKLFKKDKKVPELDLLSASEKVPTPKMAIKNLDVLFDASENEDEDGDFGDFEDYVEESDAQQPAVVDLLGLNEPDPVPIQPSKQVVPSSSLDLLEDKKAEQEQEQWDDFPEDENVDASSQPQVQSPKKSKPFKLGKFKGAIDFTTLKQPPTTIPPPGVVLTVFGTVFDLVNKQFLQPLASLSQDERKTVLAGGESTKYLQGLISVLVVCGHIIAGRKLRWKRDTILSQSMRIGPASSGKISGMKVTSIDKSEANKDDREVAEVLQLWSQQAGKIKSIITESKKLSGTQIAQAPELRDIMPIKTLSELEGGISSVKSCALCGLKRAERVGKVDVDVDDSFGEWWDEQVVMHRGMYHYYYITINFWVITNSQ
jgi:hypothetical protein